MLTESTRARMVADLELANYAAVLSMTRTRRFRAVRAMRTIRTALARSPTRPDEAAADRTGCSSSA